MRGLEYSAAELRASLPLTACYVFGDSQLRNRETGIHRIAPFDFYLPKLLLLAGRQRQKISP